MIQVSISGDDYPLLYSRFRYTTFHSLKNKQIWFRGKANKQQAWQAYTRLVGYILFTIIIKGKTNGHFTRAD